MLAILTAWCAPHLNDPEVMDQIINTLARSIERGERFLALIGRQLTTGNKPYLVQSYGEHLFINELDDDVARGYDLHGSRLRCGNFPFVPGFDRRPLNTALFTIERFDADVRRTGVTERKVKCKIDWSSANILLGGGMGILLTSNYGGNDAGLLMTLPPELAKPNGSLELDITLDGLERCKRAAGRAKDLLDLETIAALRAESIEHER